MVIMPPKKKIKFNVVKKLPAKKAPAQSIANNTEKKLPPLKKFLPSWTVFGGAYGKKHFIRKNIKTGVLQYLHSRGSEAQKGNWININSKGIKLFDDKEHKGFSLGKDRTFKHYVIDKEPLSLVEKNAPLKNTGKNIKNK